MVFKRHPIRYVVLLAAVLLSTAALPGYASEKNNSDTARITVTVEVQSALALANDGEAVAGFPVLCSVDSETGVSTYSVIDG